MLGAPDIDQQTWAIIARHEHPGHLSVDTIPRKLRISYRLNTHKGAGVTHLQRPETRPKAPHHQDGQREECYLLIVGGFERGAGDSLIASPGRRQATEAIVFTGNPFRSFDGGIRLEDGHRGCARLVKNQEASIQLRC